ncbi:MAG: hypothetical protein RLZZ165_1717, partial [Bacteroidota bacterium]
MVLPAAWGQDCRCGRAVPVPSLREGMASFPENPQASQISRPSFFASVRFMDSGADAFVSFRDTHFCVGAIGSSVYFCDTQFCTGMLKSNKIIGNLIAGLKNFKEMMPCHKWKSKHKMDQMSNMNPPPIVYKYRNWKDDNHKNWLKNNEIYLSSPGLFNDPFDCRIPPNFYLLNTPESMLKYAENVVSRNRIQIEEWGLNLEREVERILESSSDLAKVQAEHERLMFPM